MNPLMKKVGGVGIVIVIIALLALIALTAVTVLRSDQPVATETSENLPAQVYQEVGTDDLYSNYYEFPTGESEDLIYDSEPPFGTFPDATLDSLPPTLVSATVNSNIVTLVFNETINADNAPLTSAFSVAFGTTNVSVASVAVMDVRTILTLGSNAASNSVVTVTYAPPISGRRIVDLGGNAMTGFTRTATNTTPPVVVPSDTTAPVLNSARLSNKTLTLAYNETIDQNSVPATSAFTFQKNSGSAVDVTNVRISGSTVTLTLDTNPGTGSMKIKYAVPSSNPIQDAAGNDAAAFNNQSVTVTTSSATTNTSSNTTNNTVRTNTSVTTNTSAQDTIPATINTSGMSQTQLKELLGALQIRLNALIAARSSTSLNSGSSASRPAASGSSSASYTRSLRMGDSGADVTKLQKYLIAKGYLVVPTSTTLGKFGRLTQSALIQFQLEKNISPASGIFGPITRAYITAHP